MTKSRNRQFADLADSASIIDGSTASYTTAEETKLAGIEASATADQTAAEIRTLVESATDSNVFTDADHTKLNGIAASANNYVHPNHSGEVTSSADGATVITDNVVDEANLKVSNSPTNGYFLSAQSGNTGGLTWAAVSSVGGATGVDFNDNTKARFGTGNDLEIYHDGSNSIISETGTGGIRIETAGVATSGFYKQGSNPDEKIATFEPDGAVELYHDNSKKFETTSSGATITGTCTASVFNAT